MSPGSSAGSVLPFANLRASLDGPDVDEADTTFVSLADCQATGRDPHSLLAYITSLVGRKISSLNDLMAVSALDDEEEIGAFEVQEGVAISIASHGVWVVFRP